MHVVPLAAAYELFVGVDIAAATATVAWQTPKQKPSKSLTIEQTPDGFSGLHQRLMKTGAIAQQTLVVLEATVIYWLSFATYFSRLGYTGSRVNPTQAHHFARVLTQACEKGCH
jgi:transposase